MTYLTRAREVFPPRKVSYMYNISLEVESVLPRDGGGVIPVTH